MKIGFGAIGKGYAADETKKLLQSKGVVAGIINASGDMNTWGKQPNGEQWKVAITNPLDKTKRYGLLPITDGAVVTSGNYEKFVTFNNKRYTHIIDPRSGMPSSGIISVTGDEVGKLCEFHEYDFTKYKGKQRRDKVARNLVDFEVGKTILETAFGIERKQNINQVSIFDEIQ